MKVLITTVPFGDKNKYPLEMLSDGGIDYLINPLNKKLTEAELIDMVGDVDVMIAGTEPITAKVIERADKLKFISRVGIGLDGVDLLAARNNGVKISYTPDAPAPAVAELTIGLMITLLRSVHLSNLSMHGGEWHRYFGRRIAEITIGIIGVGRIGTRVLNHLKAFGTPRLLVNDIAPNKELDRKFKLEWMDKESIYKNSDLISLHVPLTAATRNMIRREQLDQMKSDAILINTCRGGVINEQDLYDVMVNGQLGAASVDVFVEEPYNGPLKEIDRCLLTAHMGSMSLDCRARMEVEATEEAIRFINGRPLISEVPETEYDVRQIVD